MYSYEFKPGIVVHEVAAMTGERRTMLLTCRGLRLVCVFLWLALQCVDVGAENMNGDINTVYERMVSYDSADTFTFTWTPQYTANSTGNAAAMVTPRPMRIHVASDNASAGNHVSVQVRSHNAASEISWSVPFSAEGLGSTTSSTSSRIICLNLSEATLNTDNTTKTSPSYNHTLIVDVSALSREPLGYTLIASPVEDFSLVADQKHETRLTPTAPVYYQYMFQPGDQQITVGIESNEMECGIASVQDALCPVYDLARDIQYSGAYQTFSSSSTLLVQRSDFPGDSFYVVLLGLSTDRQCSSRNREQFEAGNGHNAPFYNHSVSIQISKISDDYRAPVALSIVFCGCFYISILASLVIFYYMHKEELGDASLMEFILGSVDLFPELATTQADTSMILTNSGVTSRGRRRTVASSRSEVSIYYEAHDGSDVGTEAGQPGGEPLRDQDISEANEADTQPTTTADDTRGQDLNDSPLASPSSSTETNEILEPPCCCPAFDSTGKRFSLADVEKPPSGVLDKRLHTSPWIVGIVGVFYGVPVVQLVYNHQRTLFATGNQDLCYFNFRCNRRYGQLTSFNAVFSNVGYVMLGVLFILLTMRRQRMFSRTMARDPLQFTRTGIVPVFGLLFALGLALCMEGVLSACYHVCPTPINFQFDTTFMYFIVVLSLLYLYQSRNPDAVTRADKVAMFVAHVVLIVVFGILGNSLPFWCVFFALYMVGNVWAHLRLYFGNFARFRARVVDMQRARAILPISYPRHFILVILSFCLNLGLALYGLSVRPGDFPSYLLNVFVANLIFYLLFYIVMKVSHHERFRLATKVCTVLFLAFGIPAMFFFTSNVTNWEHSPSGSRALNEDCLLMGFYDNHALWHFLSAAALFFYFVALTTMDDPLLHVPRSKILSW
ncbi:SID1 transmembrane family member 1-like [Sycon ciliatum]|uniref:SID1 transmembrane family member 1-like n=1 Tax=Sycon ciliatum TaxID=27933 RepID=UPI0031F712E1|eukprot:scpid33857/ scgid30258/ SID1 transmembrane family member 1